MKIKLLGTFCLVIAALSACTPSKTTPSLPDISSQPMSGPQAAIENTEALDQALESGNTNPR